MNTIAEKAALAKAILGTQDVSVEEQSTSRLSTGSVGGTQVGRVISANFSGKANLLIGGESVFSIDTKETSSTEAIDTGIIAFDEVVVIEDETSNGLFVRDSIVVTAN